MSNTIIVSDLYIVPQVLDFCEKSGYSWVRVEHAKDISSIFVYRYFLIKNNILTLHNTEGPALEYIGGEKAYYAYGKCIGRKYSNNTWEASFNFPWFTTEQQAIRYLKLIAFQ